MKIPANEFSLPPVGFRGRQLRAWAYAFVFITLATLLSSFYYIAKHQKWFERYIIFYSYLDHSQGIQAGDPVYLMGFKIGYVTKIDVGSSEPGHERQLVLIYKVQKGYHYYINEDSILQIQRFIPGTAKLELLQGQVNPETGIPLPDHPTDQPIQVVLGSTLGGVADKFATVLDKIQNPEGSIGKLLDKSEVHDQLVSLLDSMSKTLDSTTSLVSHLDKDLTGEKGELKRALKQIGETLESTKTFIEGLKHHWLLRSAFKKENEKKEQVEKKSTKGSFAPSAPEPAPPTLKQDRTPLVEHPRKGPGNFEH